MKALPADWPAIAAAAAAGATLEELSARTGIALPTLKSRCRRGGWKTKAQEVQTKEVARAVDCGQMAPIAADGPGLIEDILRSRMKETKLGLSAYVARVASKAGKSEADGGAKLEDAQDIKHVMGVAQSLDPDAGEMAGLSLNFFSITPQPPLQGRVMDV